MWKCKVINSPSRLLDFLNENNIKPDKCINALNDWVESLSDPKNNWADDQTEGEQ